MNLRNFIQSWHSFSILAYRKAYFPQILSHIFSIIKRRFLQKFLTIFFQFSVQFSIGTNATMGCGRAENIVPVSCRTPVAYRTRIIVV